MGGILGIKFMALGSAGEKLRAPSFHFPLFSEASSSCFSSFISLAETRNRASIAVSIMLAGCVGYQEYPRRHSPALSARYPSVLH